MGILSGTVAVLHSSLRTMSNYVRLFSSQLYALASLVHVKKKKKEKLLQFENQTSFRFSNGDHHDDPPF